MTEVTDALNGAEDDAALFDEIANAPANQEQPAPEPSAPAPINEAPVAEQPQPAAQPEPPQQERREPSGMLGELISERKARQQLERQIAELTAAISRTVPQPAPSPPPEIWDDPNAFVRSAVGPDMERQQRQLDYNAKLIAEARFGEDKVVAAVTAFDELVNSRTIHPAEYQRVMQSPNKFAEAVKWHEAHKIASDPNAYKQTLKSDLMKDPEFRKEFVAALQAEASGTQQGARPVISLPSLSRVGATALPTPQGPADDASLWAEATSARKRS